MDTLDITTGFPSRLAALLLHGCLIHVTGRDYHYGHPSAGSQSEFLHGPVREKAAVHVFQWLYLSMVHPLAPIPPAPSAQSLMFQIQ